MGAVLAKFRKKESTEKKLELLEEKIQTLEKYTFNTQEQKKRFVGTFLAVSVGVYVIALLAIIYFYFPRTWRERLLYIVPLLIFPFLIIWLRRLFTWYFQRKLNKNADKLTMLREEKRKILDQVMDKETYKVAVNLLARFGGVSQSQSRLSLSAQRTNTTPYVANNQAMRALATKPANNQLTGISPQGKQTPLNPAVNQPQLPAIRTSQNLTPTPIFRSDQQLRRRTPFPIVNQAEKSFLERCLDVIIGDGPQDRFAIICRECHSHNGMALKEEFDYVAYRCAFCNAMNPARKTRPIGPRLSLAAVAANDSSPKRLHLRNNESSGDSSATTDSSDDERDGNKRRVQLRLTESTANQSESSEINEHEIKNASGNAPIASFAEEQAPEPMDIVEENDAAAGEERKELPESASSQSNDVASKDLIDTSNNDAHKKIE